jgi:hypothetical protein
MNWETLKLGPTTKQKPSGQAGEEADVKKVGKKNKSPKREDSDMPW